MVLTHIVLRALPAGAKTYKAGDKVDASNWLNREALEAGQLAYIRRIAEADSEQRASRKRGSRRAKPRSRKKA